MSEEWVVNNKYQAEKLCEYIMANIDKKLVYKIKPETRTLQQNRAIYAYCSHVARDMQARGMGVQEILTRPIEPTKESIKSLIWDKVQLILFNKKSSADLEPHEVNDVYQVIARQLAKQDIDINFGR